MTWDMLKATGKLFVDLVSGEVVDPLKQVAEELAEPHVNRKIAERLKPNLSPKLPEDQMWSKLRLKMSEEQVGELLGLPDAIIEVKLSAKNTADKVCTKGFPVDTSWSYHCKGFFVNRLDGMVYFNNQRVTFFQVYYKRGKRWYAREVPPTMWLRERKKECDSDELGTIL